MVAERARQMCGKGWGTSRNLRASTTTAEEQKLSELLYQNKQNCFVLIFLFAVARWMFFFLFSLLSFILYNIHIIIIFRIALAVCALAGQNLRVRCRRSADKIKRFITAERSADVDLRTASRWTDLPQVHTPFYTFSVYTIDMFEGRQMSDWRFVWKSKPQQLAVSPVLDQRYSSWGWAGNINTYTYGCKEREKKKRKKKRNRCNYLTRYYTFYGLNVPVVDEKSKNRFLRKTGSVRSGKLFFYTFALHIIDIW